MVFHTLVSTKMIFFFNPKEKTCFGRCCLDQPQDARDQRQLRQGPGSMSEPTFGRKGGLSTTGG